MTKEDFATNLTIFIRMKRLSSLDDTRTLLLEFLNQQTEWVIIDPREDDA